MSATEEHIAAIRKELEALNEEHAEQPNEWLAINAAIDEIEKLFKQRIID